MKENQHGLPGSRNAAGQFLLFQTGKAQTEYRPFNVDCTEPLKPLEVRPESQCFTQTAMDRLRKMARFSAMAIRLDTFNPESSADVDFFQQAADVVQSVCDAQKGLYGRIAPGWIGCFFPRKSSKACEKIAKAIRNAVSGQKQHSITIGIAQFPTLDYSGMQILENARKAVFHAEFFGPDSTTCFDAVSLNISGDRYYQEGNIQGAVDEFKKALSMDPDNVNVHNSLGVCYAVLGKLDKALEEFRTALDLDAAEMMAAYNCGLVHFLQKSYEKALELFLQAERLGSGVFETAFQLGRTFLELKRIGEAIDYFEKALRRNPDSAAAYRYLAEACILEGRFEDALSAYRTAARKNPNDAEALSALGELLNREDKDPEIAALFCRQSVHISPENGLYWERLGRVCLNQKRYEEARKALRRAVDLGRDCLKDLEKIPNPDPVETPEDISNS
ncbi:MAG: tetratricopeptide repeat protein [Desulfobacterales bacterium]|nr:tetratricopeptide repeat protein [Desulfobacterales bacterium]